jgi:hypothetical protein
MSLYCITLLSLTGIIPLRHFGWFALIAFFVGFFNACGNLLYAHAKELFPAAISGTVMTWVNSFTVSGGAVFTEGMGGGNHRPFSAHGAKLSTRGVSRDVSRLLSRYPGKRYLLRVYKAGSRTVKAGIGVRCSLQAKSLNAPDAASPLPTDREKPVTLVGRGGSAP